MAITLFVFKPSIILNSTSLLLTANASLSMMIGAVLYFNGIAHETPTTRPRMLDFLSGQAVSLLMPWQRWQFRPARTMNRALGDHEPDRCLAVAGSCRGQDALAPEGQGLSPFAALEHSRSSCHQQVGVQDQEACGWLDR
jgi:hypothetical protein